MNFPEQPSPRAEPVVVVQPCSEACACFRRLPPGNGWLDYGICTNPQSPHHGFPVRIGRECPRYVADGLPPGGTAPGTST